MPPEIFSRRKPSVSDRNTISWLQVFCEEEKVARFEIGRSYTHDSLPSEISILAANYNNVDLGRMNDMMWVPLAKRHQTLSSETIRSLGVSDFKNIPNKTVDIPVYAIRTIEPAIGSNSESVRFSWPVLNLTVDQYETLFDHPSLEPI